MKRSNSPKLSEQVAEQINDRITAGIYPENSRLPNELALSQEFGVSRATVREAVGILTTQGILWARRGSGTYVSSEAARRADTLINGRVRLRDSLEACALLETECAYLACVRGTDEEIQHILSIGQAAVDSLDRGDPDWYSVAYRFHFAISDAAHNAIYQKLMPTIKEGITPKMGNESDEQVKQYTREDFLSMMKFFRLRDAQAVRAAMQVHMQNSYYYTLGVYDAEQA